MRGDRKDLHLFYLEKSRLSELVIDIFRTWVNIRERKELLKFKDSSKQNTHNFILKTVSYKKIYISWKHRNGLPTWEIRGKKLNCFKMEHDTFTAG